MLRQFLGYVAFAVIVVTVAALLIIKPQVPEWISGGGVDAKDGNVVETEWDSATQDGLITWDALADTGSAIAWEEIDWFWENGDGNVALENGMYIIDGPGATSPVHEADRPWVADGHHAYGFLSDGTLVGKLGAATYLLEDGRRISEGHHDYGTFPDGTRVGRIGAMAYLLEDGRHVSDGYHDIVQVQDGYVAKVGAQLYILSTDGSIVKAVN